MLKSHLFAEHAAKLVNRKREKRENPPAGLLERGSAGWVAKCDADGGVLSSKAQLE